ncbi:MAG: hypothetical protein WBY71_08120 [Nitrososphaeraceae archaeon]
MINDEDKRSDVFLKERPEQYNCIIVKHNRHILRVDVVLGIRIINHSQAKAISVNEEPHSITLSFNPIISYNNILYVYKFVIEIC